MTPDERRARQDLVVVAFLKMSLARIGEPVAIMLHAPKDSERSKVLAARAPLLGLQFEEPTD